MTDIKKYYIEPESLPELFPTHKHEPAFWEVLGRTVATFGFLEEILGKAIFALTATKPYSEEDIQAAYEAWYKKLEKALTDQLSYLTKSYDKSLREHPQSTITNIDELIEQLNEAAKIRNVICHGSWRTPESTLHLFSLAGGWPGAALAQQFLRHKSAKKAFRQVFWVTVILNLGSLIWLFSSSGEKVLTLIIQ